MPSGASALALVIASAHVLDAEPDGGEQHGVGAHADGGLLGAGDRHLRHAVDLGDALGDDGVGGVVDVGGRKRAWRSAPGSAPAPLPDSTS